MADNCLPEDVNGGKSVPKRRAKKPEELKPFGTCFVIEWSDILCEAILRQRGGSFPVAFDWAIGLSDHKWQVFYRGIDAHYRIAHIAIRQHETFREAYDWIRGLSKEQYETILSRSEQYPTPPFPEPSNGS